MPRYRDEAGSVAGSFPFAGRRKQKRYWDARARGTVGLMKLSPAPVPVRRGALVRTEATGPSDADARTLVLSFVDLRFEDGHVERWLGPGSIAGFPSGESALERLQTWAEEVADDQLMSLRDEVAMSFDSVDEAHYQGWPVVVVVEWNHTRDIPAWAAGD